METAGPPPPPVDVDTPCRKPSEALDPATSTQDKTALDVHAPQHHLHCTPAALRDEPSPAAGAASASACEAAPASSLPPDTTPGYTNDPGLNSALPSAAGAAVADDTPAAPGPSAPTVPLLTQPDRTAAQDQAPEHPSDPALDNVSVPSSPLSTLTSSTDDPTLLDTPQSQQIFSSSPMGKQNQANAAAQDPRLDGFRVDYEYEGPEGHKILRLRPTVSQWNDFPSILSYARHLGAENDGCFKVVIPPDMLESLPERSSQKAPANAYQIRQVKRNGFWKVSTVPSEGLFNLPQPTPESLESVEVELQKLKKLFNKNKDKQIRSVRYRVDIPAWTTKQRLLAGVPARSPIHPLKGDKLDRTKAIIPGIHTPYVYESAAFFGATFQIHAEDYRLSSLNHLYKGRKIWIVVPSTAVDTAEEALGRKKKCSQFMRHRAEFFFPDKLKKLGVPYRIVDQRPGETIVILPDAYHEGFSTGYTIAEAKNYAESDWTTSTYQACDEKCQLLTAIPAAYMRLLGEGEERLDLCARYGDDDVTHTPKRPFDDTGQVPDAQRDPKKAKA